MAGPCAAASSQGVDAHLLSAVVHQLGITLLQIAVADKTSEIGAVSELLGQLVMEGYGFTAGALFTQRDVAYGITSLSAERASAEQPLTLVRQHWIIENRSHRVRNVVLDEDRAQTRRGHLPHVMATLRNLAIRILARPPFPVPGLHPDSGSEIINQHLLRFWAAYPGIEISRSRPYHKNDNRFVEQKNSSLVRAYVGDLRLDPVAQTKALHGLYQQLWSFNNSVDTFVPLGVRATSPSSIRPAATWPSGPCSAGSWASSRPEGRCGR